MKRVSLLQRAELSALVSNNIDDVASLSPAIARKAKLTISESIRSEKCWSTEIINGQIVCQMVLRIITKK